MSHKNVMCYRLKPEKLSAFESLCERERCPYAILGQATKQQQLVVTDKHFSNKPVNIPMELLLGKTPKTKKQISNTKAVLTKLNLQDVRFEEAVNQGVKISQLLPVKSI